MAQSPEPPETWEFGRFRVVLAVDGRPVDLGDRAFDTLVALIDSPGAVQSKEALMHRVNNLAVQISMLRRTFGADRHLIRTVAGRGYQFTGDVHRTRAASASPTRPSLTTAKRLLASLRD